MAVSAAINVNSLNADVGRAQTSIAPPFRRTKQANDGRARGDGQMRGAGVSADINLRAFGQFVETLSMKDSRHELFPIDSLARPSPPTPPRRGRR